MVVPCPSPDVFAESQGSAVNCSGTHGKWRGSTLEPLRATRSQPRSMRISPFLFSFFGVESALSRGHDVVKAEGEDPDTPGYLRGDRVRLGRRRSRIVGASSLARSR